MSVRGLDLEGLINFSELHCIRLKIWIPVLKKRMKGISHIL